MKDFFLRLSFNSQYSSLIISFKIAMANTVADMLIERLIDWGVDTIFSLPGDVINGIFERFARGETEFIQVRHEEAGAFAACGYAKFARKLGVCLATSGHGDTHLLNNLYDAKFDWQPVLGSPATLSMI
jgi:pyruvate dehydrogenase (quinone)